MSDKKKDDLTEDQLSDVSGGNWNPAGDDLVSNSEPGRPGHTPEGMPSFQRPEGAED